MAFSRGFGRPSGGFWKGLAEFLEGLGASWAPLGPSDLRFQFSGYIWLRFLRWPGFGCIMVHFLAVSSFLVTFACFC